MNPRDLAQQFTSESSAADMVRRGAAVYIKDNGRCLGIRLIDDVEIRRSRQAQLAMQLEISVSRDRGNLFFWDGCKPGSQNLPRPGVPFEPKPFEDPGMVSAGINHTAFNPDIHGGLILSGSRRYNRAVRVTHVPLSSQIKLNRQGAE